VLVLEDEALLAIEVAAALSAAGFKTIGPANSVASALTLLGQQGCDVAVLDINLGPETAEPIARRLRDARVPFVAISGYIREQQPAVFNGAPLVPKPFQLKRLVAEVERCLSEVKA
jgi:DNA-binding response OmpR family regulator